MTFRIQVSMAVMLTIGLLGGCSTICPIESGDEERKAQTKAMSRLACLSALRDCPDINIDSFDPVGLAQCVRALSSFTKDEICDALEEYCELVLTDKRFVTRDLGDCQKCQLIMMLLSWHAPVSQRYVYQARNSGRAFQEVERQWSGYPLALLGSLPFLLAPLAGSPPAFPPLKGIAEFRRIGLVAPPTFDPPTNPIAFLKEGEEFCAANSTALSASMTKSVVSMYLKAQVMRAFRSVSPFGEPEIAENLTHGEAMDQLWRSFLELLGSPKMKWSETASDFVRNYH